MSEHDEIKALVDARAFIEKRAKDLESELNTLKLILQVLDNLIATKSFKKAEALKAEVPAKPSPAPKEVYKTAIPLKTIDGKLLAIMHVGDNDIKITISEDLAKFSENVPPFKTFFLDRVLNGMRSKDEEAVKGGSLSPDKVFDYEILKEGENVKEIIIRNYREQKRLQEIKTSCRWTLEKIYEKLVEGLL